MSSTEEATDLRERQSTTDYLLAPLEPDETTADVVAELRRRHADGEPSS